MEVEGNTSANDKCCCAKDLNCLILAVLCYTVDPPQTELERVRNSKQQRKFPS